MLEILHQVLDQGPLKNVFHDLRSHVVADPCLLQADLPNLQAEHPPPPKREINVDHALKLNPIAKADQGLAQKELLDHILAEDLLLNIEADVLEAVHQNLDLVAPALALEVTAVRVIVKMNAGDSLQWQTENDIGKCIEAGKNKCN